MQNVSIFSLGYPQPGVVAFNKGLGIQDKEKKHLDLEGSEYIQFSKNPVELEGVQLLNICKVKILLHIKGIEGMHERGS